MAKHLRDETRLVFEALPLSIHEEAAGADLSDDELMAEALRLHGR